MHNTLSRMRFLRSRVKDTVTRLPGGQTDKPNRNANSAGPGIIGPDSNRLVGGSLKRAAQGGRTKTVPRVYHRCRGQRRIVPSNMRPVTSGWQARAGILAPRQADQYGGREGADSVESVERRGLGVQADCVLPGLATASRDRCHGLKKIRCCRASDRKGLRTTPSRRPKKILVLLFTLNTILINLQTLVSPMFSTIPCLNPVHACYI